MEGTLLQLFEQAGLFAVFISIFVSIVVSIAGALPSVFVTVANLLFFGLVDGLVISIIGEALGAIISFMLYRKGLKKWRAKEIQHPLFAKLKDMEGLQAFWIILGLRVLPFIPSGIVTLGSAFSNISLPIFTVASTLGKIPSLVIEAGAVYGFMQVDIEWQITIIVIIIGVVIWKVKRKK